MTNRDQNTTTGTKLLLTGVAVAAVVALAAWAVDIDVSGDLEMPEVVADVDLKGGEMPDVDVNVVDVDIKEKRATINVPTDMDVSVNTEEKSILYPTLEVTSPEENKIAEQNDIK